MEYRKAERAGLDISALSFGCMRFADQESAVDAVRKAIELGVNYFDVAPAYGGGTAEPWLGQGIKGLRDKIILTAKSSPGNGWDMPGEYNPKTGFGIRTADQVRFMIDQSMEYLGVDHLDVYHLWSCHSEVVFNEAMKPGGFLEGVLKAKEEGLFDHIGFTGHVDNDTLIKVVDGFDFEMVTVPFHLLDTSRAQAIEYCAKKGIAVIAMNPLTGGIMAGNASVLKKIAADNGLESMVEAALRIIANFPGVTAALAGITYADQAVLDAEIISRGELSAECVSGIRSSIDELYANAKHICTGCGYCGECKEGIKIPQVLDFYTNLSVAEFAPAAREELSKRMAEDPAGYNPSNCVACKECQSKCPNGFPISEMMAAASEKWPS